MMENLKNNNIKAEQVCRTCLIDEGHFFNISDTFDHYTLTQMIQNITNLQIYPSDGYTQSICFECVKEVRRANKFRSKCLESNNSLTKVQIEIPVSVCKAELASVKDIKKEDYENYNISNNYLGQESYYKSEIPDAESDCEDNEISYTERKERVKITNATRSSHNTIFDCPLCHGLFFTDNVYQKHVNELHPDRILDECFSLKPQPLGYILKETDSNKIKRIYKCASDEFVGNSFDEFRIHMKEHTGEKPVVCDECGFRTNDIPLLKKHRLQKHIEEKKISCTLCNYSCKTPKALKSHLDAHASEKNYKCKLCPMTFKFASGLSAHKMKIHEKKKPHACEICQKAYYDSRELRKHMVSHTGERPYICQYCGKGFAYPSNLKTHVGLKHEPTATIFKCDRCDFSTKLKSVLKTHVQRHNGERNFFCSECPFSSLFHHDLKAHMLRHSGVKRFTCDLCEYKCLNIHELTQHKRTHTGEKPFPCTICDYRASSKSTLTSHIQTHSTEQKFQCPNCPYKTNVKRILTKHRRRNCVILKRGRLPSKPLSIASSVVLNNEIKENTEELIEQTAVQ